MHKITQLLHSSSFPFLMKTLSPQPDPEPEILETQGSTSASNCSVKNRCMPSWGTRELFVNMETGKLQIFNVSKRVKKLYDLSEVSYVVFGKNKQILLKVSKNRSYAIKLSPSLQDVLKDIDYYQKCCKIGSLDQIINFQRPKKINYDTKWAYKSKKIKYLESSLQKKQQRLVSSFEREPSFYKKSDWIRDTKNGGLILVNKQKKKLISEVMGYTAKKAVTSGSVFNINFPTFALKPQSTIQTYCKSLGAVPLILSQTGYDPVQRIKAFNAIVLSMSIQLNDIQKSFEGGLGETFQCLIGNHKVYGEQISIKPAISAFLYIGQGYRLSGCLQLNADIKINEAVGIFSGTVSLEFSDGGVVKGIMPKGIMSGVFFGDVKFGPTGAVYSYDPIQKLVCSYEHKKKDQMDGQIGRLRPSAWKQFQSSLHSQKNQSFKHIHQKQYDNILAKVHVVWTDSISYNGVSYFSYSDPKNLPLKISKTQQHLLKSDSSFRKDIKLRSQNKIKESQNENDVFWAEEQKLRKLRNR